MDGEARFDALQPDHIEIEGEFGAKRYGELRLCSVSFTDEPNGQLLERTSRSKS